MVVSAIIMIKIGDNLLIVIAKYLIERSESVSIFRIEKEIMHGLLNWNMNSLIMVFFTNTTWYA